MKKYILLSLLLASNCFAANPSFTQVTNIVYDMIGDAEDSDFGSMAWEETNSFVRTNYFVGIFSVDNYGAKHDGVELHDTSISAGGTRITNSSASFTSQDVGKVVWLFQDSTNLTYLLTTIASVQSSTTATLSANSPVGWTNSGTLVYGSDDTAAIQAAVNAAWSSGGGVVQFQNGLYVLAGPFVNRQSSGAYNESSVITLPSHFIRASLSNKTVTITLQGLIPGAHGVSVDTNYPTLSGTILYCPSRPTIPNTGTNFNCVFGSNCETNNYGLEQYWFKNLTIRKPRNAQFHGIASVWGGGLGVEDCGIDVDYPFGDQYKNPPHFIPLFIPTNTVQNAYTDTAIWTPGTDNNSNTKINRVMVYGWGCGIEAGEHAMVTETECEFCGTGVSLFTSTPAYGSNGNSSGAFFSNFHLIGNTIEFGAFTNASAEAFMLNNVIFENKFNTTTELYDPNGGVLRGTAIYNAGHSFDTNALNYNSTNVTWFFTGNANQFPKSHLPGLADVGLLSLVTNGLLNPLPGQVLTIKSNGSIVNSNPAPNQVTMTSSNGSVAISPTPNSLGNTNFDLSVAVYYTNLLANFLVNSDWFTSGTGFTGPTNSPASLVIPPGIYQVTFVGAGIPVTGNDIMSAGIVLSSARQGTMSQSFGVFNSNLIITGQYNQTLTDWTRGSGSAVSAECFSFSGSIKITATTTAYIAASHPTVSTNSFNLSTGAWMSFQKIGNYP